MVIFYFLEDKMKAKRMIFLVLLTFFIFGCTSVPEVKRAHHIGNKKYDVVIDRDYMEDPEEFKYAVNSFVKEQGGTSYDIEKYGQNDFYITIPGEIPVEDLPEVRHFHLGRTLWLAIPPTILGLIFIIALTGGFQ
jgi:hypothetical protein